MRNLLENTTETFSTSAKDIARHPTYIPKKMPMVKRHRIDITNMMESGNKSLKNS